MEGGGEGRTEERKNTTKEEKRTIEWQEGRRRKNGEKKHASERIIVKKYEGEEGEIEEREDIKN